MRNRKDAFRGQIPVFLSELLLCAAMLGIFALIGRVSKPIFLGAVIGCGVAMLNHLALILSVLHAEICESPTKGQLKAQGYMLLRMLLMVVLLVFAMKYLKTNPIATLLPLLLMRGALFLGGVFIKKIAVSTEKEGI